MEFWVFILAVLLVAEWIQRRAYQKQNDERFARIVGSLNKLDAELRELRKLPARIAELEKRPASAAQESPTAAALFVAAPVPPPEVKPEIQIPPSLQVPPPVIVKAAEPLKPQTVVLTSADATSKLVTPTA